MSPDSTLVKRSQARPSSKLSKVREVHGSRSRHVLLASRKNLRLVRDVLKLSKNTVVSLDESEDLVVDTRLLAEVPHKDRQLSQIVSGHTREQVVHRLELKTAVEEVQPFRTGHVHCSAQLALSEGLCWAEVGCACAPVRQCDLDLQRQSGHVAHQQEKPAILSVGDRLPQEKVKEEVNVAQTGEDLGRSNPGGCAAFDGPCRCQV